MNVLTEQEQIRILAAIYSATEAEPGPDPRTLDPEQFTQGPRRQYAMWLKAGGDKQEGFNALSQAMQEAILGVDPDGKPAEPEDLLTDTDNARRLVALFGDGLRYVPQWGWMAYDGKRWKPDEHGDVYELAKATARSYRQDAAQATQDTEAEKLFTHAKSSLQARRVKAMVEMAVSDPRVRATTALFDADPWLLNCNNGTIDLRTGELRPHRRGDYLTKLCPLDYDPQAQAPLWLAFQERFADGDRELMAFKRRMYGYAVTGKTGEQCFFILWGNGANGKSTEINTVRGALGPDYGYHLETETILAKSGGYHGANCDLAALRGYRFIDAQENDFGRRLNEALIKQMTGGDPITARHLYKGPFTYMPTFKLFLATNNKPNIRGNEHAMWRRVRLVPYEVTIPEHEKVLDYHELLLEQEAAGILAWLVRGCLEWQRDGLGQCEAVTKATQDYHNEQDVLAQFMEDRCIVSPVARVAVGDLYSAYLEWCERNKERPHGKRNLSAKLKMANGIEQIKGPGGVREWLGIGLLAAEDTAEQDPAEGKGNGHVTLEQSTLEGDYDF